MDEVVHMIGTKYICYWKVFATTRYMIVARYMPVYGYIPCNIAFALSNTPIIFSCQSAISQYLAHLQTTLHHILTPKTHNLPTSPAHPIKKLNLNPVIRSCNSLTPFISAVSPTPFLGLSTPTAPASPRSSFHAFGVHCSFSASSAPVSSSNDPITAGLMDRVWTVPQVRHGLVGSREYIGMPQLWR